MTMTKKAPKELAQYLKELRDSEAYPFHMPGHKRNFTYLENPYELDITEISGFDDLHHADGIIKEAMDYASCLYGSLKSYFLVNGSSCGILAAISAVAGPGEKILMARNCHKSAYHAIYLRDIQADWIYPKYLEEGFYGALSPEKIEDYLKKNTLESDPKERIKAIMIVSPGYEGVVSDIGRIARIAHAYGCALVVDEAHGAHLPFHEEFPDSALALGADIVIQSLHKTLPSLTQTAIMHLGKEADRYVDLEKVEFFLQVYQSSSPSYLFMSSIDHCIHLMDSEEGKARMEAYLSALKELRNSLKKSLKVIKLYEPERHKGYPDYDISKLVLVMPKGIREDGGWLADQLRQKYSLEAEMNTERYVILMTSLFDKKEGYDRLFKALTRIDQELLSMQAGMEKDTSNTKKEGMDENEDLLESGLPKAAPVNAMSSSKAHQMEGRILPLSQAEGKICREYVYIYPPGIPLLIPGEVIGKSSLEVIERWRKHGFDVRGCKEDKICVLAD